MGVHQKIARADHAVINSMRRVGSRYHYYARDRSALIDPPDPPSFSCCEEIPTLPKRKIAQRCTRYVLCLLMPRWVQHCRNRFEIGRLNGCFVSARCPRKYIDRTLITEVSTVAGKLRKQRSLHYYARVGDQAVTPSLYGLSRS